MSELPLERVYTGALRLAQPLIRFAGRRHAKLGRAVRGWDGAAAEMEAWARSARDRTRPLVWVHAPSVGESLMAQAILVELRRLRSDVQVVFTHFSASAERVRTLLQADHAGYLPWDLPEVVRGAVRELEPAALVFVRTEVWPVLLREAARTGARVALVNAVLPESSTRLRAPARRLLGPAYRRLDLVGAVSGSHAERFRYFGVARERVRITGDARFDQVWARVHGGPAAESPLVRLLRDPGVTTLVAGSTWPPDERPLLTAVARVRSEFSLRLLITPHEPDEGHLRGLERALAGHGLASARLTAVEAGAVGSADRQPEVIVVDRVGVLADLYAAGDVAYVGGGFHPAGVHSVVEPAALGLPVLVGPRHGNAREAGELIRAGGGYEVSTAEGIARRLALLAKNFEQRRQAGDAALGYARSQLGGALRNAELIADLLRPNRSL